MLRRRVMLKVSDIMTKDVITVSGDTTVKDATALLFKLRISGLPVVDKEKHVIGMITEKDIIAIALPKYIEQLSDFAFVLDSEQFTKKVENLDKLLVKDIMRKEVLCITEDTPVPEAAKLMITKKVRRIPVLRDNKLVGIVARADIVKEMAREIGII